MESNGRRAFHGKNRKFWAALFIFSLMGQVAWVVENMYFNVFIYKMFHATAADISLMVERISDFYRETILPAIPKGSAAASIPSFPTWRTRSTACIPMTGRSARWKRKP